MWPLCSLPVPLGSGLCFSLSSLLMKWLSLHSSGKMFCWGQVESDPRVCVCDSLYCFCAPGHWSLRGSRMSFQEVRSSPAKAIWVRRNRQPDFFKAPNFFCSQPYNTSDQRRKSTTSFENTHYECHPKYKPRCASLAIIFASLRLLPTSQFISSVRPVSLHIFSGVQQKMVEARICFFRLLWSWF